ncbi:hypothetical protein HNY73_018395 [Argiope bruennichi]|uniref:Uncharacterized protein n=1 Tax=Argiope bruennichi TaxID=94029 RepID=A0A8T0EHP2_ARGBR|nr:hypothetical protein HNY73_018395 [Argiope bruennichi]
MDNQLVSATYQFVAIGARQYTVAKELNVRRGAIHRLWSHYQRNQNTSRRQVWMLVNHQIVTLLLLAAMCQTSEELKT